MAIQTQLLMTVAAALLKEWKKKIATEKLPPENDIATAIRRLTGWDLELRGLLESSTDAGKKLLEQVEEAIRQFQREAGNGVLSEDGIIGRKTLQEILSSLGCPGKSFVPKTSLPEGFQTTDAQGRPTSELWFQYFVISTPNLPGVHDLIDKAWNSWMEVANVRARRVKKQEHANVLIRLKYLDGPGSILGEAHVGPPVGHILELDMDEGQNWTPELFEGAICHEIGHILGLNHDPTPGRLMSEILPRGMTAPSAADAKRASSLPHLGPPPADPKPLEIPPRPGPEAPAWRRAQWDHLFGGG